MSIIQTTSVLFVAPYGQDGLSVVPSTSPWVDSPQAVFWAAAPDILTLTTLIYRPGNVSQCFVDLVLVIGGVEHTYPITAYGQMPDGIHADGNTRLELPVPIFVSAGQSVAVMLRKSGTDPTPWRFCVEYYQGTPSSHVVSTTVPSKVSPARQPGYGIAGLEDWQLVENWTQIVPSTATGWVIGGINFFTNNFYAQFEVDISTGGVGDESSHIVGTLRSTNCQLAYDTSFAVYGGAGYFFQLRPLLDVIPPGVPVTLRLRVETEQFPTGGWQVRVQYYEKPIAIADLTTTRRQLVVPFNENGKVVPAGPTPDTYGPWVEFIASTTTVIAATSLVPFGGYGVGGGPIELQIGVGPLNGEVVVGAWRTIWSTQGWYGDYHHIPIKWAPTIGVGQRVSIRARIVSSPGDWVQVAFTYVRDPDFEQRSVLNEPSQVYIGNDAGPQLVAIPDAPWTFSEWTQEVPVLTSPRLVIAVTDGYRGGACAWEFEIGIGPNLGAVTRLATIRGEIATPVAGGQYYYMPAPIAIDQGSAIWFRARKSTAGAVNSTWYLYGTKEKQHQDPEEPPVPRPSSITVYEITSPATDTTRFTYHAVGLSPATFDLAHGETREFANVPVGSGYAITQDPKPGYEAAVTISAGGGTNDNIVVPLSTGVLLTWRNRQIAPDTFSTFTREIRRVRQAPYIALENQSLVHDWFELDMQTGIGVPDGPPADRNPVVYLSWSDDGGRTWSNEYPLAVGELGDYMRVAPRWRKLGMADRGRIYRVVVSAAADWAILDAYLGLRKTR